MKRVSIVWKTKVRNHRHVANSRVGNSNIFGSDKCYKNSLCGGGSCNDCYSFDTSKGDGVGKFMTRRVRSGQ